MINDKQKGLIFAVAQFVLLFIVIVSSYIENLYLQHTQIILIRILSVILFLSGLLMGTMALISYKQKITPNPVPMENIQLRTEGIYSLIRHPMYSFALLCSIGYILYFNAYFSLILCLLVIIFLIYKIRFEEKQLIKKFPEYSDYRKHTRKLIPFIY